MPYVIALIATSAVFLAAYPLLNMKVARRQRVRTVLDPYGVQLRDHEAQDASVEPALLDHFARIVVRPSYQSRLGNALERAGEHGQRAITKLMRRKLLFAVVGLVLGGLLALSGSSFGVVFMVFGTVAGFFLPDLLAYNAALKRDELVGRSLSDALDLINLCVESGMGLQPALAQVAKTEEGPVAQEFSRVLREMQLGKSRAAAFESLAQRTKQPDLKRFVEAVAHTESLGTPVASLMKEQAAEMRMRRRENAREKAQKVPVKILFPVIVCLLPALFIIVLGPAVVSMVRAFAQM